MDRWEFWDEHFKNYYREDTHTEPINEPLDEARVVRNYILFCAHWNLNLIDELLFGNSIVENNDDIQNIDDLKKIIDIAINENDDLRLKIMDYCDEFIKKSLKVIFDKMNVKYNKSFKGTNIVEFLKEKER